MWYHTIGKNEGEGWNLVIEKMLREAGMLKLRGKNVLDLGCAEGGYTKLALEEGAKSVTSYEFDPQMRERMDTWLKDHPRSGKVELFQQDLNDLVYRLNMITKHPTIHTTVFLNLHHHLVDPVGMLMILGTLTRKQIITNGYMMDADMAPTATSRDKLSTKYVTQILEDPSLGFKITNLGSYREGRELLVANR